MNDSYQLLRTAIIEHHRWWYADDGVKRRLIILNGGSIKPNVLRGIARAYSVSRGLKKDREGEIAAILNAAMANWPTGFLDRADACIEIAKTLKNQGLTHGNQISAITKLTWFICPDDWTLYDDLAATGLGIPKMLNTVDRMRTFYRQLNDWGFTDRIAAMQTTINGSKIPELHATRILDKLLMLHGRTERIDEVRAETQAYFEILAPEAQKNLISLAKLLKGSAWVELDNLRRKSS